MFNSIYEAIGNTPMVRLTSLKEENEADIIVKIESSNPSSSIKDRAALYMIEDGEKRGLLKAGGTIIEPTSGNTGIGLAMIGAAKGYKVILVMPETMSIERRMLMTAYGAEIILTEGSKGMNGSVELAEKLAGERGYFMPNQFSNMANRLAHYETTSREILRDTEGKIDAFVAGVGTGGTVSGVGRRLKEEVENVKIYAVEPSSSQVLQGEEAGAHKIQGIGANFVPRVYDEEVVDKVMGITNEEAFEYARLLGKKAGILAGISSGANLAAAKKIAKDLGPGHVVVTVLPDTGERYLSTSLFKEEDR